MGAFGYSGPDGTFGTVEEICRSRVNRFWREIIRRISKGAGR